MLKELKKILGLYTVQDKVREFSEIEKAQKENELQREALAEEYTFQQQTYDDREKFDEETKLKVEERFSNFIKGYVNDFRKAKEDYDTLKVKKEKLLQDPYVQKSIRLDILKDSIKKINKLDISKALKNEIITKIVSKNIEKVDKEEIQKAKDKQKEKVAKVMREFKAGTLKSSSGEKVTDKDQALAIALSEAGISKSNCSKKVEKAKEDPCWQGYEQYGTKKKDGKEVPNCVKKGEDEENLFDSGNYDKIEKAEGYTKDQLKDMIKEHERLIGILEPHAEMDEKVAKELETQKEELKGYKEEWKKKTNTEPTENQRKAGNYKKGRIKVHGIDIAIENPKDSKRTGIDENGNKWESYMNNDYGYFNRTLGKDGDQIDVFLSENPEDGKIFIIDQSKSDGTFDEHKVMIGFEDETDAVTSYMANYSRGAAHYMGVTEVTPGRLKKWLNVESKGKRTKRKPYSELLRKSIPESILKAIKEKFGEDVYNEFLEKARSGKYADNAENRRLKRVGQPYGSSKGKDTTETEKTPKTEEKEGKKGSGSLDEQAKTASGSALETAAKEANDPKIREAAHKELDRREKEEKPQEEESKNLPENENTGKNTDKEEKKKDEKGSEKDSKSGKDTLGSREMITKDNT